MDVDDRTTRSVDLLDRADSILSVGAQGEGPLLLLGGAPRSRAAFAPVA